MTARTASETILSARAGEIVVRPVDMAMGTDGSTPMAIDYFKAMGGDRVFDASKIVFYLDHYRSHPLQEGIRTFARQHGIRIHPFGEGISHQLMIETGRVQPGRLVVGADSHTVTGGALGAFATGIGSSDLAAVMITGKIWLRVPETIRVRLTGALPAGVYAKDAVLELAGRLRSDGANYRALEFHGGDSLGPEDRIVFSNMSVEMGAKAGIFPREVEPGARYERTLDLELGQVAPRVARPHQVDRVVSIEEALGTPVQMVYLGTCTGGRVKDFHEALAVLEKGGGLADGVRLVITPASKQVQESLKEDGTFAKLEAMGAIVTPPGCGSCCGTAGPIPEEGWNVVSTANRNFKGRMGNGRASIYLASPAACAASAVRGRITDPREFSE